MYYRNRYDKGYERGRAESPERVTSVSARYTSTPRLSSIPVPRRENAPAPKYSSYRPSTATGSADITKYTPRAHTSITSPAPHKPTRSPDRLHVTKPSDSTSQSRSPDPSSARDKDATAKTDKAGFNSYSSYKLYPRTSSYTRPINRSEPKTDINLSRYGIGNRYSNSYSRSNGIDKTNASNMTGHSDGNSKLKYETGHETLNTRITTQTHLTNQIENGFGEGQKEEYDKPMRREPIVLMVTRHTSPTPPGSSVYVRQRRADMAKTIEETITRSPNRPEMFDKEVQSERIAQRIATMPTWSPYADTKFSPPSSGGSYTGYAGRYSTYSGGREQAGSSGSDRSSGMDGESIKKNTHDNTTHDSSSEREKSEIVSAQRVKEMKPDCVTVHRIENHPSATQPDDTSEIIINVSFKLNNSKTPIVSITPEKQITSEITINQLPPQAPKNELNPKSKKKMKIRKSSQSSTDCTNSTGKKNVRKRSTSTSSVDSEIASLDGFPAKETSEPRPLNNTSIDSVTKENNTKKKPNNKHSTSPKTSRETNSPESSITTTTQTSSSEDEFGSKSKYASTSSKKKGSSCRTSADEGSISLDHSTKQGINSRSPKNEPRTEEAKSFLIRALGPVAGFFKPRFQESDDKSHWLDSTSESTSKDVPNISTESEGRGAKNHQHEPTRNLTSEENNNVIYPNNSNKMSYDKSNTKVIRHVESGERAWWLQSDNDTQSNSESKVLSPVNPGPSEPLQRVIRHIESGERAWWLDSYNNDCQNECKKEDNSTKSEISPDISKSNVRCKTSNHNSEDKPWWLDSGAEVPQGVERISPSEITESNEKYNFFRIRHIDSGEKEWWQEGDAISSPKCSQSSGIKKNGSQPTTSSDLRANSASKPIRIRHVESGEKAWWMSDNSCGVHNEVSHCKAPRVDGCRTDESTNSDEDEECEEVAVLDRLVHVPPFPSWVAHGSPLGERISPDGGETEPREPSPYENVYVSRYTDIDDVLGPNALRALPTDSHCEEVDAARVLIHDSTPQRPIIKKLMQRSDIIDCTNEDVLDDAALQVFKDGDFGAYLDLDSTVAEQLEELEGVQDNRKNAIVLRTQLPVRVHAIIERLLNSTGRELRYTLFSLKGALGADKDLAHAFVAGRGLDALMQLAAGSDANFLNYILRALGQLVLYVDGMHGVMRHDACIRWLYAVATGRYRPAASTALKLLLVFVEYAEGNGALVTRAAAERDAADGHRPWHGALQLLREVDGADTSLALYTMTLINKCLNSLPEQDAYYDQTDALEEQGIRDIIRQYTSRQGADLDLLQQYQIYETVLSHEDGEVSSAALKQLDETIFNAISNRNLSLSKNTDRRKSRRQNINNHTKEPTEKETLTNGIRNLSITSNGYSECKTEDRPIIRNTSVDAVRRRRERFTRQASHIQQQELIASAARGQMYTAGLQHRIQNGTLGHTLNLKDALTVRAQKIETDMNSPELNESPDLNILRKRENTVKDLTQMLHNQTHQEEKVPSPRVHDLTGLISKAKEGLAKSQSKDIIRSPTMEIIPKVDIKLESELHWEELRSSLDRKLVLCDMDFTDLQADEEEDVMWMANQTGTPPPPPPPPFKLKGVPPPPPASGPLTTPSQPHTYSNGHHSIVSQCDSTESDTNTFRKAKKTVKLFWNEIKEMPLHKKSGKLIWEELPRVEIDTSVLEHLFESRSNDHLLKKLQENKKTMILDTKRSNAINIGMKKLPTPRTIKTAILKMDNTVIGREGVEKLLIMLPTDEERSKIQEAQFANPDVPLGSAEQFLLTLASITELESRLKLWSFKLDFENSEREIAEPLMDLKQGIELLKANRTFKIILSTLRSVGSFLNGQAARGFRLEYLAKVMEVKDTVHKHPLLHHICNLILEKFPDTGDFFSEVGPVIRASKVDFEELGNNLVRLEAECKASWNHLNLVAKHDGPAISRTKISEFLTDAAQRIIILGIIRKRISNRFNKFLLYLGVPLSEVSKTKPSEFLKILAEFALEYRTSRERVLQQIEKKNNHRERNKTRGKMIMDVSGFVTSSVGCSNEEAADAALKQILLQGDPDRRRKPGVSRASAPPTTELMTGDDEMLESLVRSATSQRSPHTPRDRKRARFIDRKSLPRAINGKDFSS